jgi:hypothetical protein
MDKTIAGLIGAVAGLATASGAQAEVNPPAPSEALHASSYADLLAPIANPVELLKADNAARAQQAQRATEFQIAQGYYPYYGNYPYSGYYNYPYYHNHHHHNNYYRPYSYHHHHHHHHNSAYIGIPGVGGVVVPRD